MPVSMTEESHCYENAQTEQLNWILKQEYGHGDLQDEGRSTGEARDTGVDLPIQHMAASCRTGLHDTGEAAQPVKCGVKL